jgi:hypothetical protein
MQSGKSSRRPGAEYIINHLDEGIAYVDDQYGYVMTSLVKGRTELSGVPVMSVFELSPTYETFTRLNAGISYMRDQTMVTKLASMTLRYDELFDTSVSPPSPRHDWYFSFILRNKHITRAHLDRTPWLKKKVPLVLITDELINYLSRSDSSLITITLDEYMQAADIVRKGPPDDYRFNENKLVLSVQDIITRCDPSSFEHLSLLHERLRSPCYLADSEVIALLLHIDDPSSQLAAVECLGPMDLTRRHFDVMYLHNNIRHCPYDLIRRRITADAQSIKQHRDSPQLHGLPFMTIVGVCVWTKQSDGTPLCTLKTTINNIFIQLAGLDITRSSWFSYLQVIKLIKLINDVYKDVLSTRLATAQQGDHLFISKSAWITATRIAESIMLTRPTGLTIDTTSQAEIVLPSALMNTKASAITGVTGHLSRTLSNRSAWDHIGELSII